MPHKYAPRKVLTNVLRALTGLHAAQVRQQLKQTDCTISKDAKKLMHCNFMELSRHHTAVSRILKDVEGWCTLHKGAVLYELASQADTELGL